MYKCDKCGKEIEHLPKVVDRVPCGDTDVPLAVSDEDCPCGGTYEEAFRCKECGTLFVCYAGNYEYEICYDCLKEKTKDISIVEKCYSCDDEQSDYLINTLCEYLLYKKPKQILWEAVKAYMNENYYQKNEALEYISEFIGGDLDDFAERLSEVENE